LEQWKFWKPELLEFRRMRRHFKDLETRSWLCLILMSVLKIQELKKQTNLFTNTTVSLRMFTLDNSTARENLLRKRKRSKTNWLMLS
jgi:hypothetical protein